MQLSQTLEGKETFGSSNSSLKIGVPKEYAKSFKCTGKINSFFCKVAVRRPVTLLRVISFRGTFPGFS